MWMYMYESQANVSPTPLGEFFVRISWQSKQCALALGTLYSGAQCLVGNTQPEVSLMYESFGKCYFYKYVLYKYIYKGATIRPN